MFTDATFRELERSFEIIAREYPACTLRAVASESRDVRLRRNVLEPVANDYSRGATITVFEDGGAGYASTSDLGLSGLRQAAREAEIRARLSAARKLFDASRLPPVTARDEIDRRPAGGLPGIRDCVDLARQASEGIRAAAVARNAADRIVDWTASIEMLESGSIFMSSDGARIRQWYAYVSPGLSVSAHDGRHTQQRSLGGGSHARQGGLDQVDEIGFRQRGEVLVEEALALLSAPECPEGEMDLLLMPSQMALQVHESIGHPLELDRILGDERNYAGESFVTKDMFGTYRYGSEHLNVCFEPAREHEIASFAYDDDGTPARRQDLIREGILVGAIGSASSRLRAGIPAAASARASNWNRPPIDRMGNINVLPGDCPLPELIACVERGVLMDTNRSWSIDHRRNKFQFGCELGRRIEDGELREVVRNPGYRGLSASFWRSLAKVGDETTQSVHGTLYCGKGEPNQLIHVGHVAPACVFRGVEVFGGR